MTKTYEQLVPRAERDLLEQALNMGEGYVLDFSDRTFNDFFYETLGIDPETESRLFNGRGTSKAKRLRGCLKKKWVISRGYDSFGFAKIRWSSRWPGLKSPVGTMPGGRHAMQAT